MENLQVQFQNQFNNKKIITVTEKAEEQLRKLFKEEKFQNNNTIGIRIKVAQGGCSGFKYIIEFAKNIMQFEQKISFIDFQLLIDPKAMMYIINTEMDYSEDDFSAGFIFKNPNEKSKCGCGKSFGV